MALKRICDVCGKILDYNDEYTTVSISRGRSVTGTRGEENYDLCPECLKKLGAVLKGGNVNE